MNETVEAGADATTGGNETAAHGQLTEILDADESALVRSDVNGTGRGTGQSAATVTGEGHYVGGDDEKSGMGSLAVEAVGDDTESSGQNTVAIEKVADGNGGFDWTHYLESLSNGLAEGKGQSSVTGQNVLDFQSVIKGAVKKAISVDGNTQGAGDGDISSSGQTHFHGKITEDSTKVTAEGTGDALGKLSAAANGGANLTVDEDGKVKELKGMGESTVVQNGRSDNSAAAANAQGRVDLEDGVTETNGVGSGSVNNEDDGISSLDVRGTAVDGPDMQGDGLLSVETSGGPGSVVVDGSARATTYNVDCDNEKNKDHACCKDPASDECKPKPGASGSVDKVVSIVGTDQMFKSSGTLDMKTPEGDTLMSSTNKLNATGNIDTTANGSLSITMDKEGNNEILAENRAEAKADNSEKAGIDISSSTGTDSEPRGESEITDAVARVSGQGGDTETAADTFTNVRGGKATTGGAGAQGSSVNGDGTGSEVDTEASILSEREPGTYKKMAAQSTNVASGDKTDVASSSRSDLVSDTGVAMSESTASAKGKGSSSLSLQGSATRTRTKRSADFALRRLEEERSSVRRDMRPSQPRLSRVGSRSAVCIGRKCFFAVAGPEGEGPAHLLTLADLVKAFGLKVARIADAEDQTPAADLDHLFVYANAADEDQ